MKRHTQLGEMNKLFYLFVVLSVAAFVIYLLLMIIHSPLTPYINTPLDSLHEITTSTDPKRHHLKASGQKETQKNGMKITKKIIPHTAREESVKGNPSSEVAVFKGNASSPAGSKKYVIYLCRPRQLCGGWADRQRGLVSVYILSLVTGRQFGLVMTNPCDVTHFYVPNEVNWVIPAADLVNKTSVVIQDMGSKGGVMKLLQTGDFNQKYPQDVVYIRTNCAKYHRAILQNKRYAPNLPKWVRAQVPLFFATAWNILMRPSPFLQHHLEDYLRSIGYNNRTRPLVGCHVRIGRSETLKSDGRVRMKTSDVSTLWNFVDRYVQNGSLFFLATDNMEVRNLSRQRFGNSSTDTGGSIVHVDRAKGVSDVCAGFGYAVLDQLILTKCDVLILTISGFGKRAAFIRGGSKDLFEFVGNEVKELHRLAR